MTSHKYPIPDAATGSTFFEDSNVEALLSESTILSKRSLLAVHGTIYLFSKQIDLNRHH